MLLFGVSVQDWNGKIGAVPPSHFPHAYTFLTCHLLRRKNPHTKEHKKRRFSPKKQRSADIAQKPPQRKGEASPPRDRQTSAARWTGSKVLVKKIPTVHKLPKKIYQIKFYCISIKKEKPKSYQFGSKSYHLAALRRGLLVIGTWELKCKLQKVHFDFAAKFQIVFFFRLALPYCNYARTVRYFPFKCTKILEKILSYCMCSSDN